MSTFWPQIYNMIIKLTTEATAGSPQQFVMFEHVGLAVLDFGYNFLDRGRLGYGNALKVSDLVEPDAALRAAMNLYGVDATRAVAHCALTAHYDGRKADYRFSCEVFRQLKENDEH